MGRSQINWPFYNKSSTNRGKITFGFSKDVAKSWYCKEKTGNRGASKTYSQSAIDALSLVRFKFGLTLRETQGFVESLIELMPLSINIPDYTTLGRRLAATNDDIPTKLSSGKLIHVVVDSTGLKVYGEGEWKVRQHGSSKRRSYHLDEMLDPWDPKKPIFNEALSGRNHTVYRLETILRDRRSIIPSEFLQEGSSNLAELNQRIQSFRRNEILNEVNESIQWTSQNPNMEDALKLYALRSTLQNFDANHKAKWKTIAVEFEAMEKVAELIETAINVDLQIELEKKTNFDALFRDLRDLNVPFEQIEAAFEEFFRDNADIHKTIRSKIGPSQYHVTGKSCKAIFK